MKANSYHLLFSKLWGRNLVPLVFGLVPDVDHCPQKTFPSQVSNTPGNTILGDDFYTHMDVLRIGIYFEHLHLVIFANLAQFSS